MERKYNFLEEIELVFTIWMKVSLLEEYVSKKKRKFTFLKRYGSLFVIDKNIPISYYCFYFLVIRSICETETGLSFTVFFKV